MADHMYVIVAARVPLADVLEQIINSEGGSHTVADLTSRVQTMLVDIGDWGARLYGIRGTEATKIRETEVEIALKALTLQKRIIQTAGRANGYAYVRYDNPQEKPAVFIIHNHRQTVQS